jgi:beta-glucosidase-like glycosyl hydrolase
MLIRLTIIGVIQASESFSEDPFLSGLIASAYVNGLQDEGIGAVIKHFGQYHAR